MTLPYETPVKLSSLFYETPAPVTPSRTGGGKPKVSPMKTPLSVHRNDPKMSPIQKAAIKTASFTVRFFRSGGIFFSSLFLLAISLLCVAHSSRYVHIKKPSCDEGIQSFRGKCIVPGSNTEKAFDNYKLIGKKIRNSQITSIAMLEKILAGMGFDEETLEIAVNFDDNFHVRKGIITPKLATTTEMFLFGTVFAVSTAFFITSLILRIRF